MRNRMLLATVLLLSLSFFTPGATAHAQPKLVVRTADGLSVGFGATVDMGSVPAYSQLTKSFFIYNEGNQPLLLGAPPVAAQAPFFVSSPPQTLQINPAFNTGFAIGFSSGIPGTSGVTVRILSNDPLYPSGFTFMIYATAIGAGIDVTVVGASIPNNGLYVFPITTPGVAISRLFTITNTGNFPLLIGNFALATAGGLTILEAPSTLPINGNQTATFRIRVLSNSAGTYTGVVTFTTSIPNLPTYRINLQGTVGASEIRVVSGDGINLTSGGLYTMPNTPVSVSVSRAITIFNDGNAPLNISNPASLVSGTGFSQLGQPTAQIPVNGSATFRIRLLSGTAGTYTGTLTILNDDPDENPFTVQLRGTVTP